MPSYLSAENLTAALQLRDLTDPADGKHAMQQLLGNVVDALTQSWAIPARWVRTSPLVAVEDNYDRLGFDPGAITREARYTRYVNPGVMLRSHTTATLPRLLRRMAPDAISDELYAVPGLVYRRDTIDRTHVGEPHQVDLWRLSSTARLGADDLTQMLAVLVEASFPVPTGERCRRSTPTPTTDDNSTSTSTVTGWSSPSAASPLPDCSPPPASTRTVGPGSPSAWVWIAH